MLKKRQFLNVNFAASAKKSNALGPGDRAVLWVRGCERRCTGCIAPQWWNHEPKTYARTNELADYLLISNPNVVGITLSGGEPFLQAEALLEMIQFARQHREFNVITYSGFTLQQLIDLHRPGVRGLLNEVDVLIDGEYRQEIPADDGIRGSLNQVIHFLSNRIKPIEFYQQRNPLEIHSRNGTALMIGVPTKKQLKHFNESVNQVIDKFKDINLNGGFSHEC